MNRVVVTGYGIICALGRNINEVEQALFNNVSGVSQHSIQFKEGKLTGYVGKADLLEDQSIFEKYNIPYDRCTHLALVAAAECMEHAQIKNSIDSYRSGIVIGTSLGGMLSGEKFLNQWINDGYAKADKNYLKQYPLHALSDLLSKDLNIKGPKCVISTACSAGSNAIGLGYDLIINGKCDTVLVGGVDPLTRFSYAGFNALKALDNNPCQPYSKSSGINLGEGAAFLILENYSNAKKRHTKILGEVAGYGLTADAYHHTAPDLGGRGAAKCMEMALQESQMKSSDITYVNGHGTGTSSNDNAESQAFKSTFKSCLEKVYLSSTKGATGHCLGAAGAIEAVLSLLALKNNKIPPTLRFDSEKEIGINYVPNTTIKADCTNVLSNSFAFGGNNCTLVFSKTVSKEKKSNLLNSDKIVITGIGCVGTGGSNVAELWQTVSNNQRCLERIEYKDVDDLTCKYKGKMPVINWKKEIPPKFLRRIDEITRLTMCSSREALADSKYKITNKNADRVGIIYATGTGPLDTIYSISKGLATYGSQMVSPYQFPNSVLNAAPGNVSIANMLKGPTSTISTGGISFTLAIEYANCLLHSNKADAILVVCSDECGLPLIIGNDKMGLLSSSNAMPFSKKADGMILSPGSTAFVLERENHAQNRGAKIYASLKNCEFFSEPTDLTSFTENRNAIFKCYETNLQKAGLDGVDYYLSSANGSPNIDNAERFFIENQLNKDTVIGVPSALLGTSVCTYAGYSLLVAILAFKGNCLHCIDKSDLNSNQYEYKVHTANKSINTAYINSTSFGGGCSGLLVEKYE